MDTINTQSIHNKLTYFDSNAIDETFFINGNVPYTKYDGLSICQHYKIVELFLDLFDKIQPNRVIEIGTAAGGLTLLLRDVLDLLKLESVPIITYDVIDSPLSKKIKDGNLNINFFQKNLFSEGYNELLDEQFIKQQIQADGVTILLCDGGCKSQEFNLLSCFLKPGDIIMAHDYARDAKFFQEEIHNKIWYWHEIQDSHIEETCKMNNLISFMQEEFEKVVWACKKKI